MMSSRVREQDVLAVAHLGDLEPHRLREPVELLAVRAGEGIDAVEHVDLRVLVAALAAPRPGRARAVVLPAHAVGRLGPGNQAQEELPKLAGREEGAPSSMVAKYSPAAARQSSKRIPGGVGRGWSDQLQPRVLDPDPVADPVLGVVVGDDDP